MANNLATMKQLVANEDVKARLNNLIGKSSGTFLASVLDLYNSDKLLQNCNPNAVMAECMKAASLNLPISKSLGFAYIIPYKDVPTFQMGYKGLIQLAQRTGLYKYINAGEVYDGEVINYNRISGMLEISGEATSDTVIGYFAYFALNTGFEKALYWSKERVTMHAKRFSQAYKAGRKDSPWYTNFDAMAIKTVLKQIISKYGPMTVEFASAMEQDKDEAIEAEVAANANQQPVEITADFVEPEKAAEAEPLPDDVDMEPGF